MKEDSSSSSENEDFDEKIVTKKLKLESQSEPATALIEIPFANERLAEIAYKTLSVDKGPKGEMKELSVENNKLIVRFKSNDARNLRLSLNSFLDFTVLVAKTIDRFDSLA